MHASPCATALVQKLHWDMYGLAHEAANLTEMYDKASGALDVIYMLRRYSQL